jgi:hypothetical protein
MVTGFMIVAAFICLGLGISFYLRYLTNGFEFDRDNPDPLPGDGS